MIRHSVLDYSIVVVAAALIGAGLVNLVQLFGAMS